MAGVECKDRTGASAQIVFGASNERCTAACQVVCQFNDAGFDPFASRNRWIGEDPDRDGLRETPGRLVRAYQEYFSGYRQDPEQILRKTFEETDGYDEMVVLRGIPFESHCEHHVAPIIGRAWIAYVPSHRVVYQSWRAW